MDTLIMDLVMFVQAVENDAFEPFIEDLKKEQVTYYKAEPERTFSKEDGKESIRHILFLEYGGLHTYRDLEVIVERHSKTVINYSEYNIIAKYVIAYAETHYDENMNYDIMYSEDDVIGRYDTYEEADKIFDVVSKVYRGAEPIDFIEEYYYYDADDKPFLINKTSIVSCCQIPEETYAISSASVIFLSEEDRSLTCTLDKELFEYYSLEDAKEAFEALQAVYSDPVLIPVLVKRQYEFTRTGENELIKEEIIDFVECDGRED